MSEYTTLSKGLAAAELTVTPESAQYSDSVCAKEVRIKNISGSVRANIPYVVSDWQTDVPTDEHAVNLPNVGDTVVLQLQGAGVYRFEIANNSDAASASTCIIFSARDSRFNKPLVKRGMIHKIMNGVTRRSA